MTGKQLLKRLGLNKREVEVYLAGLSAGPSTARALSQKAKLGHQLTYNALTSLQDKGLLSTSGPKYKTVFIMESADKLAKLIHRRRMELETIENNLDQLAGLLEKPKKNANKSNVRVYTGIEGLKQIAMESTESKEKVVRSLVSIKHVTDTISRSFLSSWIGEIRERKIKSKSLWTVENVDPIYQTGFRNLRVIPKGMKLPAGLLIYDNTVMIFTPKPDVMGIVIDNKEIAQTMKTIHDSIWKQSSPPRR